MQTRWQSFTESLSNIAVGYLWGQLSLLIIFPLAGLHTDAGTNLLIGVYFTVSSLIRTYVVRRYYEYRKEKLHA